MKSSTQNCAYTLYVCTCCNWLCHRRKERCSYTILLMEGSVQQAALLVRILERSEQTPSQLLTEMAAKAQQVCLNM